MRKPHIKSTDSKRLDALSANIAALRDAIGTLAVNVSVQAETLRGFKDLYENELGHIHRMLDEFKTADARLAALEAEASEARGGIKAMILAWSGVAALAGVVAEWVGVVWGRGK